MTTNLHTRSTSSAKSADLNLNTEQLETVRNTGISLLGVTKKYGNNTVVDNIDLNIQPGEFMTLLGPSGSGKTTTLNMIAGFTEITSGSLHIYGEPVTKLPAHKRELGVVFQNYALFPHRTVMENIEYPLKRRRIDKMTRKAMVARALDMVRMEPYGMRYPSELSGGQQQRIALARALVYQPKVLLMDEPLGALDKKLREWLQGEIKRIHKEVGSTFVFVTHDQEEALSLSDRIAVFNDGRIEQVGTPVELYERPQTMFVGDFLGESTILVGPGGASGDGCTRLNIGGELIQADGVLASGSPAILVRPENLTLSDATVSGASSPTRNTLPVTVDTATYLGSGWRYSVGLPDGSAGVVRMPHEAQRFLPGQDAAMTWEVSAGVLLANDGSVAEVTN